jgi:hypothetical protein
VKIEAFKRFEIGHRLFECIEEDEEVKSSRISRSLSNILWKIGIHQSVDTYQENFESYILWIKNFNQTFEDWGMDKPLSKSLKHWWTDLHEIKDEKVKLRPRGIDDLFYLWISNHRGPLTFKDIKSKMGSLEEIRDTIARKQKQSLLKSSNSANTVSYSIILIGIVMQSLFMNYGVIYFFYATNLDKSWLFVKTVLILLHFSHKKGPNVSNK